MVYIVGDEAGDQSANRIAAGPGWKYVRHFSYGRTRENLFGLRLKPERNQIEFGR